MAKALEQRWPMPADVKRVVVAKLVKVITNPQASAREITAAARALIAAEGQNQGDEHKAIDIELHTEHDRLDAIARDLGIEISLIEDATRASGGRAGGDEAIIADQDDSL